jgi:hypothetical protein
MATRRRFTAELEQVLRDIVDRDAVRSDSSSIVGSVVGGCGQAMISASSGGTRPRPARIRAMAKPRAG